MVKSNHMKDALAILSIVFLGIGFALTFLSRARSWEFGIFALIVGVIMFYIRYYSEWITNGDSHEQ